MSNLATALGEIVGKENVADSQFEKILYSHDLVPLPGLLAWMYKTIPDIVVRPRNVDQLQKVVKLAAERKIPITVQGSRTAPTGAAVPIKGGLVIDLWSLDSFIALDEENLVATVEPGMVWERLMRLLEKEGLALKTYPTSTPSSTVGGWVGASGSGFGVGGVGVGSVKYGPLVDNIAFMEILLPNGEIRNVPDEKFSVADFIGTDGILGIATKIGVCVRKKPEITKSFAFHFPLQKEMANALEEVSREIKIFFCEYECDVLHEMKKQAGIKTHGHGCVACFTLDGDPEAAKADLNRLIEITRNHNGEYLGDELGEEIWMERFNTVKVKRAGPSILSSEFTLGCANLKDVFPALKRIGRKFGVPVGIQGLLINDGGATVIPIILKDERKGLSFTLSTGIKRSIDKVALRLGGKPYGAGHFNAIFAREIHGQRLGRLKTLKRELDPAGIMNPAKSIKHMTRFGVPVPRFFYNMGLSTFAMLNRMGIGR